LSLEQALYQRWVLSQASDSLQEVAVSELSLSDIFRPDAVKHFAFVAVNFRSALPDNGFVEINIRLFIQSFLVVALIRI